MTIKRIFTDMDGTLLNSKGQLSKDNAKAIRKANIPLTLVSARAPMEMMEVIETLKLQGPQVAFNGGLIFQMKNKTIQPLHVNIIPKRTVQQLLTTIRQSFPKVSLSYYDISHWYCDKIDKGIRFEYELTQQAPTLITDANRFLLGQENTFKLMMVSFEEIEIQTLEKMLHSLNLTTISIQRSGKFYLEITSKHAQKSKGIHYILKRENLAKTETAAFGDGHNDIPMLKTVGYPIVMENASDEIKSLAYKITKSNDQDGVGYGIQKFIKKVNHGQHSSNRKNQRLFSF